MPLDVIGAPSSILPCELVDPHKSGNSYPHPLRLTGWANPQPVRRLIAVQTATPKWRKIGRKSVDPFNFAFENGRIKAVVTLVEHAELNGVTWLEIVCLD
jgi:hypothetical protein